MWAPCHAPVGWICGFAPGLDLRGGSAASIGPPVGPGDPAAVLGETYPGPGCVCGGRPAASGYTASKTCRYG